MIKTVRHIEYRVYSGSGHGGPAVFDNEADARKDAEEKASVPSYMGPGRTHAQLVEVDTTTTVEDIW